MIVLLLEYSFTSILLHILGYGHVLKVVHSEFSFALPETKIHHTSLSVHHFSATHMHYTIKIYYFLLR